jgi:hypothetical protein
MTLCNTTVRQRIANYRRHQTMLYRSLRELEQHQPVMTDRMREAGITEHKLQRAHEARLRDARAQVDLARRRIAAMKGAADRRLRPTKPSTARRRPAMRAARSIGSRARRTRSSASKPPGIGDGDPDPARRRISSSGGAS